VKLIDKNEKIFLIMLDENDNVVSIAIPSFSGTNRKLGDKL